MKMISRTSITSTSGTTLISDREVETRELRPRRPPPPVPVACTFGIFVNLRSQLQTPNFKPPRAIRFGVWSLRFEIDMARLRKVPLRDVQELEREIVHVAREVLHAVREVVVKIHRRDRGEEARGRGDQRVRNAGRDHPEARRAGETDGLERIHDAPHGTEQSDERGDAGS